MENDTITEPMELKVTELIKEVQLDYSPSFTKLVDDTVSSIKDSINKIPNDLKVTASEAPDFVRDIGADKVEFIFKKPSAIEVGGSYSIKCVVKPDVNVDLLVRLPKECFHEKDYLNHRYHGKRFLYLCIIKKYLKSSAKFQKVEWSTLQNEARKPVLHIYPVMKDVQDPLFFVRLIPSAKSLFSISKLDLKRNNIRVLNQEGSLPVPTPRYNTSILEDMVLEDNIKFLLNNFLEWQELREALVLLKVWARQRSSIFVHDCLNGYLLSVMLLYLATYEKVNKSMRPLHMFRVIMGFIANSKLWSRGLYFKKQGEVKISEEERVLHKGLYPVVICDENHVNLGFRISNSGFFELQDEAALTIKCLETSGDSSFEDIFMTKIDFPAKYDYCIRLNLKEMIKDSTSGFCSDDECWRLYEHKVHSLLVQGLTDRAKCIRVIWRNIPLECRLEKGLAVLDREPLLVGISITSLEKALRIVDIGPDVENKEEALRFRNFWGEKAELRRFKDGKIAESTVWESEQWTRHLILKRIIEHILPQHLSLPETNIVQIVDQLDFSLLNGVRDPISTTASLLGAFDTLSKRVRDIEDIPLRVSSVQPLNPAFRFTSVFPPEPHPLASKKIDTSKLHKPTPTCIEPLEVMIQLEGSGNWPVDDISIEKTKSAFLLKIGESLQNHWGMTCIATEDVVDVFLSGYAFRLKILHERGLNLARRESNGYVKPVSSIDRKLFYRSQHSGMINGLQGLFPAYGPVVRLAKRWVASHMFSACLVEEAVELLVAHLFVKPLPLTPPSSRITGFLRLLRLLANYDWEFSPLIIDINNDLSQSDRKEILDNFMLSRKAYGENTQNTMPNMFLATSYDKASGAWTSCSPSLLELKRLTAYARSSANLLTRLVLGDQTDTYRWECLFRTPLNNYNAVILLHGDRLAYPSRLLFPSQLNQGRLVACGAASKSFWPLLRACDLRGSLDEVKKKLMVDFNPLRSYVSDLENEFNNLKFWYDSVGGDAIGLTWEKLCTKKHSREETNEGEEDPDEMLRCIGEVGKGFVRSVHFLKSPRLTS